MAQTSSNDSSGIVQILDNSSRLGGVVYRVATKADYRKLHAFLAEEKQPYSRLGFPTVFAEKDGVVIGLIATVIKNEMIFAGPLVTKSDKPRHFTALRLVEAHESALQSMGITSYIFSAEGPKMLAHAEKLGLKAYAVEDGVSYFVRRLGGASGSS